MIYNVGLRDTNNGRVTDGKISSDLKIIPLVGENTNKMRKNDLFVHLEHQKWIMRILLSIAIGLFLSTAVYGQEYRTSKLTREDSLELSNVWAKFKHALEIKDIQILHRLSLPSIDCDLFQPMDTRPEQNPNISIDTFLNEFYERFPDFKLWRAVKTKKYHMTTEPAIYSGQINIKSKRNKSLMLYYIWYLVFEPNEVAKGYEGQSEAFQFMKINGKFKFYGMTSIP